MEQTIPIISRRLYIAGATPLDIPIAPHIDVAGADSGVLIVRVHTAPSGGTWTVHARNSCTSTDNPNLDFIDTSREVVSVAVSGSTRNLWHASLSAPIGERLYIYLSMPAMIAYIAISVELVIRGIWIREANPFRGMLPEVLALLDEGGALPHLTPDDNFSARLDKSSAPTVFMPETRLSSIARRSGDDTLRTAPVPSRSLDGSIVSEQSFRAAGQGSGQFDTDNNSDEPAETQLREVTESHESWYTWVHLNPKYIGGWSR